MSAKWSMSGVVVLLGIVGCRASDSSGSPDLRSSTSRDRSTTPVIGIRLFPEHLKSNVTPDVEMKLEFTSLNAVFDEVEIEKRVKAAVSLVALPGKTSVALKWTDFSVQWTKATFKPSAPLANDAEYALVVQRQGAVTPQRERSVFHVGSLPRVTQVSAIPRDSASPSSEVGSIAILFSEPISPAAVSKGVMVADAASGKSLTIVPYTVTTPGDLATLELPPGVSFGDTLSLTIPVDVGAPSGRKLDGRYTGVAGSGPFTVELVLSAAKQQAPWEPPLSF